METLQDRARKIRLLCTDVDGVLTNGALHYGAEAGHTKNFHVRDGLGIVWLRRCGIRVAFISGLDSLATRQRAQDLGLDDCFVGHLNKGPVLEQLCAKYELEPSQVAHIGDDLPDLPLLTRVGLACCPQDAVEEVRHAAHWVVPLDGGKAVLRPIAELILQTQGHWNGLVHSYRG